MLLLLGFLCWRQRKHEIRLQEYMDTVMPRPLTLSLRPQKEVGSKQSSGVNHISPVTFSTHSTITSAVWSDGEQSENSSESLSHEDNPASDQYYQPGHDREDSWTESFQASLDTIDETTANLRAQFVERRLALPETGETAPPDYYSVVGQRSGWTARSGSLFPERGVGLQAYVSSQ
ncbi:hypothetical protein PM082_009648 [Marasmius tenuissimus]|nr:hypothetical protein PM082_009648 [Marasmius tenuissimus]